MQTRFKTMKLPKPIIAIHQAVDNIDKLKRKRAALAEEILGEKTRITRLMKRNKKKLGALPNDGILYLLGGYRVELFNDEKLTTKRLQES